MRDWARDRKQRILIPSIPTVPFPAPSSLVWTVVGTLIDAAPVVGTPSTPVIQDGVLLGPAGTYRVVNNTLLTDEELELAPPVPLDSLGTPGDSLTIYYYVFSSSSPDIELPGGAITETIAPTFGPYTAGDTPEDSYVEGTYASTEGTIVSIAPSWTINGVAAAGTDVLVEDDVVDLSVLVTDSAANDRTFEYAAADPAAPGSTQIMVTAVGTLARAGTTVTLTPATWDEGGVTVAATKTINGSTTALVGTTFTVALGDDYYVSEVASKSGFVDSDPAVTATGYYAFQEEWDWLANGNTWTEVDARYSRSSTGVTTPVVTDASAPSGVAVQWQSTTTTHRWADADALTAWLAGRTTEVVEVLILFRLLSTASVRTGFGHFAASNQHTGAYWQRVGAADQRLYAQGVGDPGSNTNISSIVGTYSDNDLVWVRFQVDGVNVRARSWLDGAGEGGSWTTYVHGSALAFTSAGPMVRTSGVNSQILYYAVAIDATAPGP